MLRSLTPVARSAWKNAKRILPVRSYVSRATSFNCNTVAPNVGASSRLRNINSCQCRRDFYTTPSAMTTTEPTSADFDTAAAEKIELVMSDKTHEELLQDTKEQFREVAQGQDQKFLDPQDVKKFVVAEIKQNSDSLSDASVQYVLSKVDECLSQADRNNDGKIELHEFFELWRRLSMVQLEGIRSSTGVDLRAALETMIKVEQ